ncbi:MAG: hypothetical protein ACKOA0_01305 [Burkholderiaceae bacterium]
MFSNFKVASLILSLLLAQWVGLTHSIAHSGIASAQAISASGSEPIEHSKSASHCAAFDAATLGASLHSSGLLVLPAIRGSAAVKLPIPDGVARLTTRHFNSRAPPQPA